MSYKYDICDPAGTLKSLCKEIVRTNRYHRVLQAVNLKFWPLGSETEHGLYVGSYGRNTAIDTSDLDILVEIPEREYCRYSDYERNGQSRLLQRIRETIKKTWPASEISADGQVVKIDFSDQMKFEVLPAFPNCSYSCNFCNVTYKYPDANMGGHWKTTNPRAEQQAFRNKDYSSNGLLCETCRYVRTIRDKYSSYHLSGILIDSFVFDAIGTYRFPYAGARNLHFASSYWSSLLYSYNKMTKNGKCSVPLNAPGSNMSVDTSAGWDVLGKILNRTVSGG